MATKAHCIYAFESLAASFDERDAAPPPLARIEDLWDAYTASSTDARGSVPPAVDGALSSASPTPPPAPASASASAPSSNQASADTSATSLCESTSPPSSKYGAPSPSPSPLFVTWNTLSASGGKDTKRLRGCIGTFDPQPLERGLNTYALTSAFEDTRFQPIRQSELPRLSAEVILLTDFEAVEDPLDWALGVHGVRIAFTQRGQRYGATYLPDVAREQGWSKEETMQSLVEKAHWRGPWRGVGVKVTRYQGRKVGVAHAEWTAWRAWCVQRGLL